MRASTKRIIEEHATALEKIAREQREAQAKFLAEHPEIVEYRAKQEGSK